MDAGWEWLWTNRVFAACLGAAVGVVILAVLEWRDRRYYR